MHKSLRLVVYLWYFISMRLFSSERPRDTQDEIALTEHLAASDSVPSILDANIRASGGMDDGVN